MRDAGSPGRAHSAAGPGEGALHPLQGGQHYRPGDGTTCDYGTMSLLDCMSAGSEYNSGARFAASGRGYQAQKSIRIILESRLGPVIR